MSATYTHGWLSRAGRLTAIRAAGGTCERCGLHDEDVAGLWPKLRVHHRQPLGKQGDHRPENLEVLCEPCHEKEHGRRFTGWHKPQGRPKGTGKPGYPCLAPAYDTEEGMRLWRAVARRRQCSVAAAIRQVVREEAQRLGIPVHDDGGDTS